MLPRLEGTPVFIGAGRSDAIAPPAQAEALAELLRRAGAEVHLYWDAGGHSVTRGELDAAREWLIHSLTSGARPGIS
jgi:phospholipase/carboxylesterase